MCEMHLREVIVFCPEDKNIQFFEDLSFKLGKFLRTLSKSLTYSKMLLVSPHLFTFHINQGQLFVDLGVSVGDGQ